MRARARANTHTCKEEDDDGCDNQQRDPDNSRDESKLRKDTGTKQHNKKNAKQTSGRLVEGRVNQRRYHTDWSTLKIISLTPSLISCMHDSRLLSHVLHHVST